MKVETGSYVRVGRSVRQPGVIFMILFLFLWLVGVTVYGKACEHAFLQGSASYGLWAKSYLLPIFVNKVLLKHSYVHLSLYCSWLL